MHENIVLPFFAKFSRYEYALKMAGKVKAAKNDAAEADWEHVERVLRQLSSEDIHRMKASAGLLLTDPPRRQVVLNGQLQWTAAGSQGNWAKDLVSSLKRVRNNLFHGGKYAPSGMVLTPRSAEFVQCAHAVLDELVELPALADVATQFRSYHPDEG